MEKELGFGEISPKKIEISNFLEVLHAFLWYSFSSWDLCVYIFCKQLCQQKTSPLDIVPVTISRQYRQYRAASRQWLLSNNIVQDLALACPTYSICLLGEFWQGLSIHNHQSDRCSTNGVKIWVTALWPYN